MSPVRFPAGDPVLVEQPFDQSFFPTADDFLRRGYCNSGWLEIATDSARLICLIHKAKPFLAGLVEPGHIGWVPLRDLPIRAGQMEDARCKMDHADLVRVLLLAVQFRSEPVLRATTRFVDLAHVLQVLAEAGQDSAVVLERDGVQTLMFLRQGVPMHLFFGDPAADPKVGEVAERFLVYGFAPEAPVGKVEVYNRLRIDPDPDAGQSLMDLVRQAIPPPPMYVQVWKSHEMIAQRRFMPPWMTIGRDHGCELILDEVKVSRHHARLSWERGQFVIQDMGSANGTRINATAVERAAVRPGDRIQVGDFLLMLALPAEDSAPRATVMMPEGQPGGDVLFLVSNEISLPVTDPLSLGSGKNARVRVRGMFIRPQHAVIQPVGPDVLRIECAGSRSRVTVNGKSVHSALLRAGDELRVGKVSFKLVPVPSYALGRGPVPPA
ncbi:MAG: FHA domain-containing protein [Deltaproteobacteria bacterium]|nr:FHA domain-containing protein [Deltaproteobacteria bacterium]